jgi:hypothetical protein
MQENIHVFSSVKGWAAWAACCASIMLTLCGCQSQTGSPGQPSNMPLTAAEVEQRIQTVQNDPRIPAAEKPGVIEGIKRDAATGGNVVR